MIKVAVTGGIGTGKSIVCSVFERLGIPVFNADNAAKILIDTNQEIKNSFIELFGKDIYQLNGAIDRKKLANIIFNNNFVLQKVNAIVHPLVFLEFDKWTAIQSAPFVIQEAAILFENGHSDRFEKIITVSAPFELKIKRCMERDSVTRELIEERMKNQLSDEFKAAHSDFVIINNDEEMILPQILNIYKQLI